MTLDIDTIKILAFVLAASLVHTLIPSHWLTFVVVGREQKWKLRTILLTAAGAGTLHVLSTVAIGIGINVVWAGLVDEENLEKMSALILLVIGIIYVVLHLTKRECGGHGHQHQISPGKPAIVGLFLMLILSPCEAVLPMFLNVRAGDQALLFAMTVVLLVTTVGSMLMLILLAYKGMDKIKFHFIEHNERFVIGVILCMMGAVLYLL